MTLEHDSSLFNAQIRTGVLESELRSSLGVGPWRSLGWEEKREATGMEFFQKVQDELHLILILLACSILGGYLGGRLALQQAPRTCTVIVRVVGPAPGDPELGPIFGHPQPVGVQGSYIL